MKDPTGQLEIVDSSGQAEGVFVKDNEIIRTENDQLRNALASLTDRQTALEDMFLAISTTLPKDKLVKLGGVSH